MDRKYGKRCRGLARAFLRRQEGSAAPLLAFTLVVLVGAAGLAFDGGRSFLMKAKLSQAVDAAALAGGRSVQTAARATTRRRSSSTSMRTWATACSAPRLATRIFGSAPTVT